MPGLQILHIAPNNFILLLIIILSYFLNILTPLLYVLWRPTKKFCTLPAAEWQKL